MKEQVEGASKTGFVDLEANMMISYSRNTQERLDTLTNSEMNACLSHLTLSG